MPVLKQAIFQDLDLRNQYLPLLLRNEGFYIKICFAFGGFHLGGQREEQVRKIIEDIKALGVEKIGPTHCTGDESIAMFREAWGENFVSIGAGKQIRLQISEKLCAK